LEREGEDIEGVREGMRRQEAPPKSLLQCLSFFFFFSLV
jgi:hypothetical protein